MARFRLAVAAAAAAATVVPLAAQGPTLSLGARYRPSAFESRAPHPLPPAVGLSGHLLLWDPPTGRWRTEGAFRIDHVRTFSGSIGFRAQGAMAWQDRPLSRTTGEVHLAGQLERGWAGGSVGLGVAAAREFATPTDLVAALGSASFSVGVLSVRAEVGRALTFASASGSRASTLPPVSPPDTLVTGVLRSVAQETGGTVDTLQPSALTRRFDHATLISAIRVGSFSAGGMLARRFGFEGPDRWAWRLEGRYQIDRRFAIRLEGGRAPIGTSLLLPGRSVISLGLEWNPTSRPAAEGGEPLVAGAQLHAWRLEGTLALVEVRVAGAQSVEIMGDFSDWTAVALSEDSPERWSVQLSIPPGVHYFNLRYDGGRWTVPVGYPSIADGFGGRTGILTLPR